MKARTNERHNLQSADPGIADSSTRHHYGIFAMTLRKHLPLVLLVSLLTTGNSGFAAPGDSAEQLFRSATQTDDLQQRLRLLDESIAAEPSFEAWYMKGLTLQQMRQPNQAIKALGESRGYATNQDYAALALARSAQVMTEQGQGLEGLALINKAIKLHHNPPEWMQTFQLELNSQFARQALSQDEIAQTLSSNSVRSFGVRPSINLQINFKWNRYDLDSQGRAQLTELISALASLQAQGDSYQIIGHTDSSGDAKYNRQLSQQRAATVQREVALALGPNSPTLCIQGMGEDAPLFSPDETKEKQRLNRRVEIKAVRSCP